MLYRHWKKFALALTGFFWASCDDTVTSEDPLYGCPDDVCKQGPIDDSSSSTDGAATSSSEQEQISSSSRDFEVMPLYGVSEKFIVLSSSSEESSSSFTEVAPAYGVPGGLGCYEDPEGRKYDGSKLYRCDDGATCVEKDSITGYGSLPCSPMETEEGLVEICPDYGIVAITEKTYTCDDGKVYNEAEFLARYNRKNTVKPTSSSSSDIIPADTLYGVIEPKDDTLNTPIDTSFTEPIALYGPPCMFSGTCDEEEK